MQLHGGYRKDFFGKTRRKAGSNEGKGEGGYGGYREVEGDNRTISR